MLNSVEIGPELQSTKLFSFTASSDFTSVLPYVIDFYHTSLFTVA